VLRQIGEGVAGGVRVPQKKKLDALLSIIEHQLFVEDDRRRLECTGRHILASRRSFPGQFELCRTFHPQEQSAVRLGDDACPRIGKNRIAVRMIAVVMRVEHVTDGFIGRLLDRGNYILGFLREVGIDDYDIILENDPDVIAAAKRDVRALGADGRVTEEHAGSDFLDVVEVHFRQIAIASMGRHARPDKRDYPEGESSTSHD
jgi:hypothetical protein